MKKMIESIRVGVYTTEVQVPEYMKTNEKRNELSGLIGIVIHKLLVNYCQNISYTLLSSVGNKLENGSYTDALNLLNKGEIDIYFYYEPYTELPINVLPTSTFGSRSLHYCHSYEIKSKNSSISLIFNQFDWSIWTTIFALSLILSGLGYYIKLRDLDFLNLRFLLDSIFDIIQFILQYKISECFSKENIKWIIFFVFISFFQITFIFSTLIKTDVVTVDTSSIINSLSKIIFSMNHNYTCCWIKNEIQVRSFEKAKPNSLLYNFWHKYNDKNRCYFNYRSDGIVDLKNKKVIVFSDHNNILFERGLVTSLKKKVIDAFSSKSFQKERCYFSNLNQLKDEYKSKLNQLNLIYYEDGLIFLILIQLAIILIAVIQKIKIFIQYSKIRSFNKKSTKFFKKIKTKINGS